LRTIGRKRANSDKRILHSCETIARAAQAAVHRMLGSARSFRLIANSGRWSSNELSIAIPTG
jgi:hypothetical protein